MGTATWIWAISRCFSNSSGYRPGRVISYGYRARRMVAPGAVAPWIGVAFPGAGVVQ